MKKSIKKISLFLLCGIILFSPINAKAESLESTDNNGDNVLVEVLDIESTAYTWTGNPMKNGEYPYEGVCATKTDWIGGICELFEKMPDGTLKRIGKYEIKDTGGHEKIKNGTCVDIYMSSEKECFEYGRKNVIAYIYQKEKKGI